VRFLADSNIVAQAVRALRAAEWVRDSAVKSEDQNLSKGRITLEPGKRGGQPTIRGLRITVHDVLRQLADGATEQDVLADFPELESADIRACIEYAAERKRKPF
jgi:uncharacterized protein (DUF433 family)